jgi:hypothetical protein
MTEIPPALSEPRREPGPDIASHADSVLTHLIVLFLAPMFLAASNGDLALARMAAAGALSAYRARDDADLIAIALIIAYGLAALGSLSLSMADDLSLSMTLRLRGNANALNRSAEQNRRALRERLASHAARHEPTWSDASPLTDDEFPDIQHEAAVLASVAEAQQRVAEACPAAAEPRPTAPVAEQPPIPTRVANPKPASPSAPQEQQMQAVWAAGMAEVAKEFADSLPHLPPAERKMASMRAAALSSSANALLLGVSPPRLKPGDLGAIIRPNKI